MTTEPLTVFDYEFLTGNWTGPHGAAWNVVFEDCRNMGYGGYNDPTELGKRRIEEYLAEHG